jgi:hypothetical protein
MIYRLASELKIVAYKLPYLCYMPQQTNYSTEQTLDQIRKWNYQVAKIKKLVFDNPLN